MASWTMSKIEVTRKYEVTDAPDLQDGSAARRRVIRPRSVKVLQCYGTNLVRGAVIEGRQVRRDGELAGSRQILAGLSESAWGYNSPPPGWLNEILADEGLEWMEARGE